MSRQQWTSVEPKLNGKAEKNDFEKNTLTAELLSSPVNSRLNIQTVWYGPAVRGFCGLWKVNCAYIPYDGKFLAICDLQLLAFFS